MIGSIGMFVLMSNLISLVPGFASPTAEKSVPLGCAIVVFLYYNWSGLLHHGPLKYGKTFLGPVLVMSPIMAVVEVFSHLARMLSLTVRLWVNMLVSELLYVTFLGIDIVAVPVCGEAQRVGIYFWLRCHCWLPVFLFCCIFSSDSCRRLFSLYCQSFMWAAR